MNRFSDPLAWFEHPIRLAEVDPDREPLHLDRHHSGDPFPVTPPEFAEALRRDRPEVRVVAATADEMSFDADDSGIIGRYARTSLTLQPGWGTSTELDLIVWARRQLHGVSLWWLVPGSFEERPIPAGGADELRRALASYG